MPRLTKDQLFIVQKIVEGKQLKQIAFELGISTGAVKVRLFRARQRAGVENNFQLVALSVFHGWIVPPLPDLAAVQSFQRTQYKTTRALDGERHPKRALIRL